MSLNLMATIALDGSKFEQGFNRVKASVADSVKGFIIGAIGVATIGEAFRKTIQTADELVTSSKRLSIGVEQLQVLRRAALDNNVEFDRLASTFEKLDVARAKALGGGAGAQLMQRSFSALGVTPEALRTQSSADLIMGPIAETIRKTNPEQIAGPLRDVLGRSFGQLIPVLKTDFGELSGKLKSFGAIMDTATAVQLKMFKDEMGIIGNILTSQLAPVLVQFGEVVFKVFELFQIAGAFWGTLISDWMHGQFKGSKADAVEQGRIVKDQFDQAWEDFQKRITGQATSLDHPKAPDFTKEEGQQKEFQRGRLSSENDSLLRVGNFLGASRGSFSGVQQQILQHTVTIANNTTRSTAYLAELRTSMTKSGFFNDHPAFQLHPETIFPSN